MGRRNEGRCGNRALSAEGIETSFSDVFKSLRFGFMGAFEGRKDRFDLAGDRGVNYAISPTTIARFGYRYLKVDYHRDDFLYNVATGGFYAGVGMRFYRLQCLEGGDSNGQH